MCRVQTVYDSVDALRAAAACAWLKPESAVKLLEQAANLVSDGIAATDGGLGTAEDSFDEWSRMTGIDHRDPEQMAAVYRAVEAMRQKDLEREAASTVRHKPRTTPRPGRTK